MAGRISREGQVENQVGLGWGAVLHAATAGQELRRTERLVARPMRRVCPCTPASRDSGRRSGRCSRRNGRTWCPAPGASTGSTRLPRLGVETCLVRFDNNRYSVAAGAIVRPIEIRAHAGVQDLLSGKLLCAVRPPLVRTKLAEPVNLSPMISPLKSQVKGFLPIMSWPDAEIRPSSDRLPTSSPEPRRPSPASNRALIEPGVANLVITSDSCPP